MVKGKDDGFLKKLLSTFRVEAEEHITALSSGLMELEKTRKPEIQAKIVETVFREAHSLKGAARAVTRSDIESVCQSLEGVFSAAKHHEIAVSQDVLDVLLHAVDYLQRLVSLAEVQSPSGAEEEVAEITRKLDSLLAGDRQVDPGASVPQPGSKPAVTQSDLPVLEAPRAAETIRVATARLDSILLQAEEMLSAKLAAEQGAADLGRITSSVTSLAREWRRMQPDFQALRSSTEHHDRPYVKESGITGVTGILDFIERSQGILKSLETELNAATRSAAQERRTIGAMVDNLLEDTKLALMLPFSSLLEVFPRLVRELARDQGKEIDLVLKGTEIEADRHILEEIKDPLIHLVRNCIDHGIEKEEDRIRKNKPGRGTITMAISQKSRYRVEIDVADDGAGIDPAKVRSAAIKQGVLAEEEARSLSDEEALQLVFRSGISTNPVVTDVSGRGLGLAIVREKVELLGGVVTFDTQIDAGTTFRMMLPLARATYRGLLVKVDERLFVLPIGNVERVLAVARDAIKTVENRETIKIMDETVSLVRLDVVLELPVQRTPREPIETVQVVVLTSSGRRIGFLVDEVLHEQEILVKSLGPQLTRVRNVAGATVLGTGEVVPILSVHDLIRTAIESTASPFESRVSGLEQEEETGKERSILVVEDSITARTLLKNILEGAGYHVTTAVDGVDGYTRLRAGEFDVVVSDVDMPRMSGFELTAKIRSDKKYSEIPVVLVTALERREDRERGIDVGANAYVVKSSFDQSNLLEIIRRFV